MEAFFILQKKKIRIHKPKISNRLPGPPEIIQIGPHSEWRKIMKLGTPIEIATWRQQDEAILGAPLVWPMLP